MRAIKRIIWHCSATREGVDVSVETIRSWHKTRGFNDIGYHFVIMLDGSVREGRPIEIAGAHVEHHNLDSIGICYVGGVDANGKPRDTRTPEQKAALYQLTKDLIGRFPGATVHGHNEFAAKACPSFNAKNDWAEYLAGDSSGDEEPVDLPKPVLRREATGGSVNALQRLLAIKVTGTFDATTETAVRSFQLQVGLVADGVVGPKTWGRLV